MIRVFVGDNPENKPLENAEWLEYILIDTRTTDDPAKIPISYGDGSWWYKEGTNHRVENGQIKRDLKDNAWFITVETLEDLYALMVEHKGCSIRVLFYNPQYLELRL